MKVLITGGAGFIGSHLAAHFQRTADVRVLDDLSTGKAKNLAGLNVEFCQASITDRKAVRAAMSGVDYVLHLAAMVSVPQSMRQPAACVEINVLGLLNVLEEAAAAGVRKLCFSSSAAVYGNNPIEFKDESLRPDPRSPYAITKLDGEYYCQMFAAAGDIKTVSFRYFNVFGPRQDPNSVYAAAVPIFIRQALAGEPLVIHGDGQQTRDFVFVSDVVAANAFALANDGLTGVFNVGSGKKQTIIALARDIVAAVGSSSEIRHAPERPGDVRHSCASVAKLHSAGFRLPTDFANGLQATVDSFRECMSRSSQDQDATLSATSRPGVWS
jgi:UDP-glucose 4-epimerase